MGPVKTRQVVDSLQVFRGLAALAVVIHHAAMSTIAFIGPIPASLARAADHGYLGVDFFFVLSGFIIMHNHQHDDATPLAAREYIRKRLIRIFPPYVPVSLLLLALYAALPGLSASGGRSFSWLSSLFLVPANDPPALSVAWTLVHELQFYAVFLLFYFSRRVFVGFFLLWSIAILCRNGHPLPEPWWRYPLSPLNIEFMFGLIVAYVAARFSLLRRWSSLFLGLGGLVVWLGCLAIRESVELARIILAFGLAGIILGCVYLEQTQRLWWPGLLILMGNASYSIYLIHNPLLSLTQRILGRWQVDWATGLTLGVLISLAAGVGYHLYVEQRLLGLFRRASG